MSYSQRDRLAFLEMHAYFVGKLRRGDLEARFSIKPAAATRDINAYRQQAPGNLAYDRYIKAYVPASTFRPIYGFSAERVLSWLLHGFGDGQSPGVARSIPCIGPGELVRPDFNVLGEITRAIHAVRPIQVNYLSLSSGAGKRVVVPVALADNGLRWHLRAFDRQRQRFSDFVITRITKVKQLEERAHPNEQLAADDQWNREVALELVPHPGLQHPEAIIADYGMRQGKLMLTVPGALAGYALLKWGVDCSPGARLDPARHHLCLANPSVLGGVESAALAPGFKNSMEELGADH